MQNQDPLILEVAVPAAISSQGTTTSTILFFDKEYLDKAIQKKSNNEFIFEDKFQSQSLMQTPVAINLFIVPKEFVGAVRVATSFIWPAHVDPNNAEQQEIMSKVSKLWKYLQEAVQKSKNIEGGVFDTLNSRGIYGGSKPRPASSRRL